MTTSRNDQSINAAGEISARRNVDRDALGAGARLTSELVWRALHKQSFAVLGYSTPAGDPRSSGVVYGLTSGTLCVAVAPDSWKAKHIAASGRVSVTVPIRRGGLLALIFPIPPATVSFHGKAIVRRADSAEGTAILAELGSLLPPERRTSAVLIEIAPEDEFLTYGLGVSLRDMRVPAVARAHVPVASSASLHEGA